MWSPDCVVPVYYTGAPFAAGSLGPTTPFNNRTTVCTYWSLTYSAQGLSSLSIQLESAPDNGGVPGTWLAFQGTLLSGANPATATTQQTSVFTGFYPWIRVNLTAAAANTGSIVGMAYGYRLPIATVAVQGVSGGTNLPVSQTTAASLNAQVVGPVASGAAVSGNPVRVGGNDGTNVQDARAVSAANLTQSVQAGSLVVEKGARWQVVAQPAVSTQASASKAAGGAGVRHVADCISFSAGSTTAPALTQLLVNLRDGATGAGTILLTKVIVISAATGQNTPPFQACGLNAVGSAATAMTLEWSAGLTNLFQEATISGFDVQ